MAALGQKGQTKSIYVRCLDGRRQEPRIYQQLLTLIILVIWYKWERGRVDKASVPNVGFLNVREFESH